MELGLTFCLLVLQLIAGDGQEVAGVIADPACDMWSLGVIAFHILSGAAFLPPSQ